MGNTNTSSVLKTVEDLYLKGEFGEALDYVSKNRHDLSASLYHFTLGTLYSKNNQIGLGRLHLEKAVKKGGINNFTLTNLSLTASQKQIEDLSNSPLLFERLMDQGLVFPLKGYGIISLLVFIFVFYLIRIKKFQTNLIKVVMVLLSLIPIGLGYFLHNSLTSAIVMQDIPVREGPSKIYEENTLVSEGSKVIVKSHVNGWYAIEYPKHLAGWIKDDAIQTY
jgi:hypothetical protein